MTAKAVWHELYPGGVGYLTEEPLRVEVSESWNAKPHSTDDLRRMALCRAALELAEEHVRRRRQYKVTGQSTELSSDKNKAMMKDIRTVALETMRVVEAVEHDSDAEPSSDSESDTDSDAEMNYGRKAE